MEQKKIDRINQLARKKKEQGLTQQEKTEQRLLREEFLADFRARFKAQLDNIEFVEDQGSDNAVEKGKAKQD